MNKDYLYNVLNLYLNQEKINTTLTIVKGSSYIFIFGIEDETWKE